MIPVVTLRFPYWGIPNWGFSGDFASGTFEGSAPSFRERPVQAFQPMIQHWVLHLPLLCTPARVGGGGAKRFHSGETLRPRDFGGSCTARGRGQNSNGQTAETPLANRLKARSGVHRGQICIGHIALFPCAGGVMNLRASPPPRCFPRGLPTVSLCAPVPVHAGPRRRTVPYAYSNANESPGD